MASQTTQPAVIDTLLTGIRANLSDLTILVSDGYPVDRPTVMVSVGGQSSPTEVGTQAWSYLGARTKEERYKVEITVSVILGGDGQASETAGDAQKAARDICYTVVHTIEAYLNGDPTLGQFFNTGTRKGGWISLTDTILHQTDDLNAAMGAIAEAVIQVEVFALI